jgi:hypothetical protein
MSEKFIGYFRLVEACGKAGCPVCRSVRDESRQHLDALLYEQVTDSDTRRGLRASWGFCNWHTWMLLEIENSLFGSAIIYEDLVRLFVERVSRLAQRRRPGGLRAWIAGIGWRRPSTLVEVYRRRRMCPICARAAETEDRYLLDAVRFIGDPELQLAYARSDGLCAPHMIRALEVATPGAEVRELLERTLAKWSKLREDIGSFVGKHDYRNRDPFTEAETASYMRAFEMLAGAKNVFGNDLHKGDRSRTGIAGRPRGAPIL